MKLSEYQQSENIFAMFKGDPGTGKTVAAGSFPNPYFISTDGKIGSLKLFYPNKDDIEFDKFNSYWDVFEKLERLQDSCPYKTVVLDSLTRAARLAMSHSMQFRPDDTQLGKTDEARFTIAGRHRGKLLLPDMGDYGGESQGLWQLLSKLHVLNEKWSANIILICHVVPSQGLKGETRSIMTGGKKIAAEIPGEFDEIYHFSVQGGLTSDEHNQFLVSTQNNGNDFARTALPLDPVINFTDSSFYNIWQQQITSAGTGQSNQPKEKS